MNCQFFFPQLESYWLSDLTNPSGIILDTFPNSSTYNITQSLENKIDRADLGIIRFLRKWKFPRSFNLNTKLHEPKT